MNIPPRQREEQTMAKPAAELLTTSTVARKLGLAENTIRSLERRGILSATRDSANRRLFDRAAVDRFLHNRDHDRASRR